MIEFKKMWCLKSGIICLTAIGGLVTISGSEAGLFNLIYGMPAPDSCDASHSQGTNRCYWNSQGMSSDRAEILWWDPEFKSGRGDNVAAGFSGNYVPYAGLWRARLHLCPSVFKNHCSAFSSIYVDSLKQVALTGRSSILSQKPNFGGAMPASFKEGYSGCWTFVAEDGSEWNTKAGRTCQDSHQLPEEPTDCMLNYGEALDVALGDLDKERISVAPGQGSRVVKVVPVMCKGDATMDAKMQIDYTPVTFGKVSMASSSTRGLGVAIFYNGQSVSPSDSFDMRFEPGSSSFELGFEAIRDAIMSLDDLATGAFSASAVVRITET